MTMVPSEPDFRNFGYHILDDDTVAEDGTRLLAETPVKTLQLKEGFTGPQWTIWACYDRDNFSSGRINQVKYDSATLWLTYTGTRDDKHYYRHVKTGDIYSVPTIEEQRRAAAERVRYTDEKTALAKAYRKSPERKLASRSARRASLVVAVSSVVAVLAGVQGWQPIAMLSASVALMFFLWAFVQAQVASEAPVPTWTPMNVPRGTMWFTPMELNAMRQEERIRRQQQIAAATAAAAYLAYEHHQRREHKFQRGLQDREHRYQERKEWAQNHGFRPGPWGY